MKTIKNYTQEDLDYIINNYNNKTIKELSLELGKSNESISYVIKKLGIIKQSHNKWAVEEIEFLKKNYINMTSEEISKYINHSIDSINSQRDRLNLIRNATWSDEEINFLMQNYKILSHEEISNKLGRTKQSITAKCCDLKLYKKELPWTNKEIEFIKNNYMEMPTNDISFLLKRTPNAIKLKAERMGMKKYPYMCDYNYFDVIDSEEKAYWLGFLTADGWISKNKNNNAGVTGIELQYRDINHLKKFNKSLKGNYKITDRWKNCPISCDKNKKNHMCCLRIFSLTMYNSLVNLGFTSNKSYNAQIPKVITSEFIRHYLRGYFDGDGCLCITNKSFHVSFITASKYLFNDLIRVLQDNGFNGNTYSYISEYNTQLYNISLDRNIDKINFLDWIYKDSNIYLDRKYKKYLKALKKYRTNDCLTS